MTEQEIQSAVHLMLRQDRITLNAAVPTLAECQAVAARYGSKSVLAENQAVEVTGRLLESYKKQILRPLTDDEKLAVVGAMEMIAGMPSGQAHAWVDVLISQKMWFPDKKAVAKLEKLAVERQNKLVGLSAAHSKEAQRRATAAAEEERLKADRALRTPEQRAAYVVATLAKFRGATKCA